MTTPGEISLIRNPSVRLRTETVPTLLGLPTNGAVLRSLRLNDEARPILGELVAQCGETVHLGVLDASELADLADHGLWPVYAGLVPAGGREGGTVGSGLSGKVVVQPVCPRSCLALFRLIF
jgi:hypothetical protein